MIIGVPKEVKNNEFRVGITPGGVSAIIETGNKVLVQKNAGEGSGFPDDEYIKAGAKIVTLKKVWETDLVVKVKEPQPSEIQFLKKNLILFTYLHLANPGLRELTIKMIDRGVTSIAYETVTLPNGTTPLLEPMSEIAGRMSIQVAAQHLEKPKGGMGKLIGGVPGVEPATIVIIGAGTVGANAAYTALGFGANVIVLNRSVKRLRRLVETVGLSHPGNLVTLALNPANLQWVLSVADVVIGAVYVKGAKCPKIISREMLSVMKAGSVIVDVSIDQGGICDSSHPTSHSEPVYIVDDVIHYCVANMPGALPMTSTKALTNATLPYVLKLARLGFTGAIKQDSSLTLGVNTYKGYITEKGVAEAHNLPYKTLKELFS